MFRGSNAGRRHIDLAWIGLGIGDELGNGLCGKRWMHRHDVWDTADTGDWSDVTDKIEVELLVERRVDRVIRSEEAYSRPELPSRPPRCRYCCRHPAGCR